MSGAVATGYGTDEQGREAARHHAMVAELSLLHELSALLFTKSMDQLALEAVEKATRLFDARYFALISGPAPERRLLAGSGFRTLEDALKRLETSEGESRSLKLVFHEEAGHEDIVYLEQARPMNERTRRLCTVFARRLADRLAAFRVREGYRLAEEALRESEKRAQRQRTAVAALALDEAVAAGDVPTAMQRITEAMSHAIDVERASVWFLSEDGTQLRCASLYRAGEKEHSRGETLRTADFPRYFEAIRADSRICAHDAQHDPRTRELTQDYFAPLGIVSLLDAGIRKNGGLAGVVSLEHTGQKRQWHVDEEAFASTVAALVSQALANAEYREATEALQESEAMLRKSQAAAGIGSYTVDLLEDACKGSTVLNDILGIPAAEQHPMEVWPALIHPEWRERVMQAHERAVNTVTRFDEEYKIIRRRDGEERWVHDVGTFETDEQGRPAKLVGTIMDITERKLAEKEREKLREQLLQAQKLESVGRLAGGIAHDFNNMLAVIIGFTEMALTTVSPEQGLYVPLEETHKAAVRSADLVRQLLAFARRQTIDPRVLNLNDTVVKMLNMLRRLIGEEIDLIWRPGQDIWPVRMDPVQIDQILANLCVNARDAITGTGHITIETGKEFLDEAYCSIHAGVVPGEYTLLAVSDNGSGIPRHDHDKIFDPFFTRKGAGQGTGLGLAMVYGAIQQNNGVIHLYSEPGEGTTFRIYLPRHVTEGDEIEAQDEENDSAGRGETVLLVEDEPAIMRMGKTMLEGLGYRVLATDMPGEAMKIAEEHAGRIDLLMTDVVMPEMNGRDLAGRLQQRHADLRCLFMSGYPEEVITQHGVLEDGVHFIEKPFSVKDLAASLRKALQYGQRPAAGTSQSMMRVPS